MKTQFLTIFTIIINQYEEGDRCVLKRSKDQ